MKDPSEKESDQWIPWEVSYSLKEISRKDRKSRTNAILAVVLPDRLSSCRYFLEDDSCPKCHCTTYRTDKLFQILRDNMFNVKTPTFNGCSFHPTDNPVYCAPFSYIHSVKWRDFVEDMEAYLQTAEERRDNIDSYNITKTVKD